MWTTFSRDEIVSKWLNQNELYTMPEAPKCSKVYQNHHLDGTRWDSFRPRNDDIVIATSYKSGTTWTQAIVANLLFPNQQFPEPIWKMSPWLDFRLSPLDELIAMLDEQRHRRFIKTHLGLDGLRYYPEVKYIFVSRDGRDVFMSLWNHYANYTEEAISELNDSHGLVGAELPIAPADIHDFWKSWCTRGWFSWEHDGWPFWSHLSVTQSWWNYRHLENILILHFDDMKKDITGTISRVARFLEIDISPERVGKVAEAVSFDKMKKQGQNYVPDGGVAWKDGSDTFFNKGTNGRWHDVLSADELALYDLAGERTLSNDCRIWLNNGGLLEEED